jgi:hypothetical protein
MKILAYATAVIGVIGLAVLVYGIISLLFEIVWNYVMPTVFHLPDLNIWEAAAIVFLLGFIGKWSGVSSKK